MKADTTTHAKLDANGNLEFEDLDTKQLLAILASRIQAMDERIAGLEQRIDGKMVTRDDLQSFGRRMERLESDVKRHGAWIDKQQALAQQSRQSFGARFKSKASDYLILAVIVILAAAIIGGVTSYVSDNREMTEIRRDIDELQRLK